MELFEKEFDEYRKEFRKYKSGQKRDKARNLMEFVTVQEAVRKLFIMHMLILVHMEPQTVY